MRLIPKDLIKSEDVHFRTTPEIKAVIKTAAKERGVNLTDYCEMILAAASGYVAESYQEQEYNIIEPIEKRKTEIVTVHLSKRSKALIGEKAKVAKMSKSKFMEASALGKEIVIIDGLKELTHEVAKIGTNINQLTILAHQGRIIEPDLFGANDTLKQILKRLIELNKTAKRK